MNYQSIDLKGILRELKALRGEGEKVDSGARLFKALGGEQCSKKLLVKVRQSEEGRRLLKESRRLTQVLADRDALRALPKGSLGRQYINWADAEGLYPEGLHEILDNTQLPPEEHKDSHFLSDRGRDLHDLLHVLTGYDRDLAGEAALLAFTAIQECESALSILSALSCIHALFSGRPDVITLSWKARRRARHAPFLIVQDWEILLTQPIDQVRRDLKLLPVPEYQALANEAVV